MFSKIITGFCYHHSFLLQVDDRDLWYHLSRQYGWTSISSLFSPVLSLVFRLILHIHLKWFLYLHLLHVPRCLMIHMLLLDQQLLVHRLLTYIYHNSLFLTFAFPSLKTSYLPPCRKSNPYDSLSKFLSPNTL